MLAGDKQVEKWLIQNGYSKIEKLELQLNDLAFKAEGNIQHILVQVKTFLHPNRLYKLSDFETDLLIRRAVKLQAVAYVAYVILDYKGKLMEEIKWERLS